jgi:hypothetical protein
MSEAAGTMKMGVDTQIYRLSPATKDFLAGAMLFTTFNTIITVQDSFIPFLPFRDTSQLLNIVSFFCPVITSKCCNHTPCYKCGLLCI